MSMLIRNAEIAGRPVDVHLSGNRIVSVQPAGQAQASRCPGEQVLEARGGALLPGLHDHHIHLMGLAAATHSVACGPPEVTEAASLRARLRLAAAQPDRAWLRGVGYHESVAGDIDRYWLDRIVPDRPVRIQHRTGRLWLLNSAGLACLPTEPSSPLERRDGRLTGRLYDGDVWLRQQLSSHYPPLRDVCLTLARHGVTGLTDASSSNDRQTFTHLLQQTQAGVIPQRLSVMGDGSLSGTTGHQRIEVGALKIHLHEHALPDLESTVRAVSAAHDAGRVAAFHCVTEGELVYALAVLDGSGPLAGDRIEHAGSVPDELLRAVADRELTVVTQPHFIHERGDQYHRDIPMAEHNWLYRCAAWRRSAIPLASGSDAPYGTANPWTAMQAAVDRRTRSGLYLGPDEALTPEQALELYLSPARAPGKCLREVTAGVAGDLCLLDRSWEAARKDLASVRVRATFCNGQLIAPQTAASNAPVESNVT